MRQSFHTVSKTRFLGSHVEDDDVTGSSVDTALLDGGQTRRRNSRCCSYWSRQSWITWFSVRPMTS